MVLTFLLATNNLKAQNVFPTASGTNVGIGTSTPAARLNVDPQGAGGILIGNPSTASGNYASLSLNISTAQNGYSYIQSVRASGNAYGLLALNPNGGDVVYGQTSGYNSVWIPAPYIADWQHYIKIDQPNNQVIISNGNSDQGGGVMRPTINGGETRFFSYGNYYNSASFMTFYTMGAERARLDAYGNLGLGTLYPSGKLDLFTNSGNATNLVLSADYNNKYRWRFNTVDRGNAIDMDITASDVNDTQQTILKLAPTFSGRPAFALEGNWLVANNGNIGINTTDGTAWTLASSPYKLAVGGKVIAESVTVKLQANWPDYVFKPGYTPMPLSVVSAFIAENHHLPELPTEEEIQKKGLDLGEINKLLTKKVEELTLYLIERDAKEKEQDERLKKLEKRIDDLTKILTARN